MPFRIEYSPEAEEHLRMLTPRRQEIVWTLWMSSYRLCQQSRPGIANPCVSTR